MNGAFSVSGGTVTFAPTQPLSLLTRYDISVGTAVTDLTGKNLQSAFNSSITTRDGQWMPKALKLEEDETDWISNPMDVGIDGEGNAFVVYQMQSGSIWIRRWTSKKQEWSAAVALTTDTKPSLSKMAVSENGNAAIVYSRPHSSDATRSQLAAVYYVASASGGHWDGEKILSTYANGPMRVTTVSMDPAGNAIVTWEKSGPPPYLTQPFWTRYDASAGVWLPDGTAFEIAVPDGGSSPSVDVPVGMDGLGNAYGVFDLYGAIWWTQFADGGFGPAREIVPPSVPGTTPFPLPFVDRSGLHLVVWTNNRALNARVLLADGGTKAELPIQEADAGAPPTFQVRGSAGRAGIVWARNATPSPGESELYASQCDIVGGGGCGQAVFLGKNPKGYMTPSIGLDLNGNAIAAWTTDEPGSLENVWASRYVAATKQWGTPTLIESDDSWSGSSALPAGPPAMAMGRDGRAIVIWRQIQPTEDGGTRGDLWYNRFH